MGGHSHDYCLVAEERYRDENNNESILQIYHCECGAGKAVPKYATLISTEFMVRSLWPETPEERKKRINDRSTI